VLLRAGAEVITEETYWYRSRTSPCDTANALMQAPLGSWLRQDERRYGGAEELSGRAW
jgi:hypothetical protein